jgi:hypothetical protein
MFVLTEIIECIFLFILFIYYLFSKISPLSRLITDVAQDGVFTVFPGIALRILWMLQLHFDDIGHTLATYL